MAYTQAEIDMINAVFEGLPEQVKELFNAKSSRDTSDAISQVISQKRQVGLEQAIESVITGSVSSWPTLAGIAEVADGATIYENIKSFNNAMTAADNANNLLVAAVSVCLAARKHFNQFS